MGENNEVEPDIVKEKPEKLARFRVELQERTTVAYQILEGELKDMEALERTKGPFWASVSFGVAGGSGVRLAADGNLSTTAYVILAVVFFFSLISAISFVRHWNQYRKQAASTAHRVRSESVKKRAIHDGS